jgi:hypothetical protein
LVPWVPQGPQCTLSGIESHSHFLDGKPDSHVQVGNGYWFQDCKVLRRQLIQLNNHLVWNYKALCSGLMKTGRGNNPPQYLIQVD